MELSVLVDDQFEQDGQDDFEDEFDNDLKKDEL